MKTRTDQRATLSTLSAHFCLYLYSADQGESAVFFAVEIRLGHGEVRCLLSPTRSMIALIRNSSDLRPAL